MLSLTDVVQKGHREADVASYVDKLSYCSAAKQASYLFALDNCLVTHYTCLHDSDIR